MFGSILLAIAEIFTFFAIGYLANHLGYIKETQVNNWSHFLIDFLFPMKIFHTIVTGLDPNRMHELWLLPFIGFGLMAFGLLAGLPLQRGLASDNRDEHKTFLHFCVVNNYSFLPVIILGRLWGEQAEANLFVLNIGSIVGAWTLGIGVLGGMESPRTMLRKIMTPALGAILLALLFSLSGISEHIPSFFLEITGKMGAGAIPLILIIIGATLHTVSFKTGVRDLIYMTAVRLVVLPLLTIGILFLIPMPRDFYQIAVVIAIMPVAVSSAILTRRYGGAPHLASRAAVVTTVISIATIPLFVTIFL
jgi:malate permease and related proteins